LNFDGWSIEKVERKSRENSNTKEGGKAIFKFSLKSFDISTTWCHSHTKEGPSSNFSRSKLPYKRGGTASNFTPSSLPRKRSPPSSFPLLLHHLEGSCVEASPRWTSFFSIAGGCLEVPRSLRRSSTLGSTWGKSS
jgi:hypothetical protein